MDMFADIAAKPVEAKPKASEATQPAAPPVATETKPDQEQQATAILDRANVTGTDRLDIMRDFRDGKHTLADLGAAYPEAKASPEPTEAAPDEAKPAKAEPAQDKNFHYTNGNMGMTSGGSFTADQSRWITFTRDEPGTKPRRWEAVWRNQGRAICWCGIWQESADSSAVSRTRRHRHRDVQPWQRLIMAKLSLLS